MLSAPFTNPDFSTIKQIGWYPEALTFAVVISFTDGATLKASVSGVGLDSLYQKAREANVAIVELCHFCQVNTANERLTTDGDTIIICDACAEVEEF